jgi:peptidoglycan/LPS O-acetylase OafA/YrhL
VLLVWAIAIVLCGFLFSSSSNAYLRFLGVQMPFEFFFGIVAGALVATRRQRMPVAAILIGIVLAAWLFSVPETNPQVPSPLLWFRVALAGAAFSTLLYGLVVTEIRGTFRAGKACDVLGDASYAIYLWHLPVLTALGLGILRFPPVLRSLHELWIAVGFAAVFATGIIVFRIIERPLTRYLNRRLKQHLPTS